MQLLTISVRRNAPFFGIFGSKVCVGCTHFLKSSTTILEDKCLPCNKDQKNKNEFKIGYPIEDKSDYILLRLWNKYIFDFAEICCDHAHKCFCAHSSVNIKLTLQSLSELEKKSKRNK
mmetsp:Transcript_24018/g.58115  ORF Transcript_24018/g.58115 Transcript_24018/m.58115 type:complete len:118 (+) Transcript_24018:1867-2220(+)